MKKLLIYKQVGDSRIEEYVIERVNPFNHATKRFFVSEQGLLEGLKAYKPVMEEYELEVSEDLWAIVINFLNSKEYQE